MKVTQMPTVHTANLAANSGITTYGVDVIPMAVVIFDSGNGCVLLRKLTMSKTSDVKWSDCATKVWMSFCLMRSGTYKHMIYIYIYINPCRDQQWVSISSSNHDDVIKWIPFPRDRPFVRGTRVLVDSSQKGQWHRALMFSVICIWTNGWTNNRDDGDLRHHGSHCYVTVKMDRFKALGRRWIRTK